MDADSSPNECASGSIAIVDGLVGEVAQQGHLISSGLVGWPR